jgi:hypothetical protein
MKKNLIFVMMSMILLITTPLLTSCNNDEIFEQPVQHNEESSLKVSALAATTPTYYVTPTVGNYTPNSTSNTTLSSVYGNYVGGLIKARVVNQSGNTFAIEIRKQDGTPFSAAGMAKVKAGSVGGGEAGSCGYSVMNYAVVVQVTATFTQGITHFYPIVESYSGGVKYFAEPIMVYTSPMYNIKTSYSTYENIGTANGVIVQAAGPNLIDNTLAGILSVQCTEFCNRYYSQVYGKNIINSGTNGGHAKTWYDNSTAKGLRQIPNGTAPRVGDILCMNNNPTSNTKYGHVAIIIEVTDSYIKIAQQNAGKVTLGISNYDTYWTHAIGGQLSYNSSTKTITAPSGFSIQGLLRL